MKRHNLNQTQIPKPAVVLYSEETPAQPQSPTETADQNPYQASQTPTQEPALANATPTINPQPLESPNQTYTAYTILRKPGGLYIMRKLIVVGKKVVSEIDNVDDLFSIQMAHVETEFETAAQ